jgi:hypothetical protein
MWRTELGVRILKGAEARVFAEALAGLLDEAIMGALDDYELGVRCFDDLTYGQKISVLAIIGNGLLREDVPPVELTAVVEGAIAAVFKHLTYEIIYDIDEPDCPRPWRKWVVAARQEMDGEDIPPVNCKDIDRWETEVEELADRILWDADYEDAELYIDFPPDKSKELRDCDGIPDKYFIAIADDLSDEEAKAQIKELQNLCDSISPEQSQDLPE